MSQCKQCGQPIRLNDLFDWPNATHLLQDCYRCGRITTGGGSWVFVYATSGALVACGILIRSDIKELLHHPGIDVPDQLIIGGPIFMPPVFAFFLAFLIAWKNEQYSPA